MEHISVEIPVISEEETELLTAQLMGIGFTGFEEKNGSLIGYIASELYQKESVSALLTRLEKSFKKELVKEVNWNANWESSFNPVEIFNPSTVKPFARIRASFHEADKGFVHDLIIDPKMSFGTGHHATTKLMVEQMSELDFRGKQVIDFGTGTGLLAILASKMGAAHVIAIDNDDWSLQNAAENLLLNKVSNVALIKKDSYPGNSRADIILANINRNILLDNMSKMGESVFSDGTILMSGILLEDESIIISDITPKAIGNLFVKRLDSWSLIGVKKH